MPGAKPMGGGIALREYEILYVVRPDLDEAQLEEAVAKVSGLIETLGGQHERTNVWGKRRLAYEVNHLREGYYVLTEFQIDTGHVPELESTLKISDTVFRHLIVRRPERKKSADGKQPEAASQAATEAAAEPAPADVEEAPAAAPEQEEEGDVQP
jgi:small subunit ribosomal protein S6